MFSMQRIPDGDDVYYYISWKKVSDSNTASCSPDEPVDFWFGPYTSGEELEKNHTFYKCGEYELTVQAKDTHDSTGPATTITVTYKSSTSHLPILSKLMEKYPEIFKILAMIF